MKSTLFRTVAAVMVLAVLLYASGVAPAAYNLIMDEAAGLARRTTLNFTGAGVTCADNPGSARTDCTITSGGTSIVGTGGPNYSKPFAGVGSLTITNAEHGFGHANLLVSCYDNSAPPQFFEPALVTINAATYQVDITFVGTPTGYCVVNGGAGTGCAVYTITSANAAFIAASTTADVALFTLPQYAKVQGVTIKHSAQFSDGAGAMTDVSASVGNAAAPYVQYAGASSIGEVTAPGDTIFYDTVGFKSTTMAAAGGTVSTHFIATGRNFGDGANTFLTGGSVNIWVCSLRVQ